MERHPALGCSASLEAVQTDLLQEQGKAESPPGRLHSAPLGKKSALLLSIEQESKSSDLIPHFLSTFILSSHLVTEVCNIPRCHGPHQDGLARLC